MDVRILKVAIQNYRSCHQCDTQFEPDISVLIGPNGSGKTNILTALTLLKKLAEFDWRKSASDQQYTVQSRLEIVFKYGKKSIGYTAIIDMYTDDHNSDVIVNARQFWDLKSFITNNAKSQIPPKLHTPLSALHSIGNEKKSYQMNIRDRFALSYIRSEGLDKYPKSARKALQAIYDFVFQMKYYSASQFINPSDNPVAFEIEEEGSRNYGLKLRNKGQILLDMYNADKSPSNKDYMEFKEIIGRHGIRLIDKVSFKAIKTSSVEHTVRAGGNIRTHKRQKKLVIPQFMIGKQLLSPNQLSEGTFKTIALLFYLITDKSSLLLLEEPEVCVHHGLLESIIELIKIHSYNKQIIMSTHSDYVLDKVEPSKVFKISTSSNTGTIITHIISALSSRQLSALKDYLATEGNLGEYWKHGRLE